MKYNRYLKSPLLCGSLLLLSLLGGGCEKTESPEAPAPDRTVLLYMVGDNSLSSFCSENMDSIVSGMGKPGASIDFLVYEDSKANPPTLWKFTKEKKGKVTKEPILEFPERNSVDPEVMTEVINTVFSRYPSEELGLILWSHATGWLPSPTYSSRSRSVEPYSFGQDYSNYMEIWELREVLEGVPYLDFLIFDACHMASVEVAYELKDEVKYLISSPTEVMGAGFPYQTMVPILNRQELDLKGVCQAYMDFYSGTGSSQEGAISLIQTSALEEVAAEYAKVIANSGDVMDNLDSSSLQQFGRLVGYSTDFRNIFFDIRDVVDHVAPDKLADFDVALNKCVLYKGNSPRFLGIPINKNSGLSVFVQQLHEDPTYQIAYTHLRWYQETR